MALARPLPPLWPALCAAVHAPVRPVLDLPLLQRLAQPFRASPTPAAALAIPAIEFPSLPSLADIWDGLLQAVPKKKTSYRKKRQRFMAGKSLQDITALHKCPACGRVKRAHMLCPYCVNAIKTSIFGQLNWAVRRPTAKQSKQMARERLRDKRQQRAAEDDPRRQKEDQILKHTGWKG
ncbi:hypothetical protein ACEQ8H_007826 [Pleosporales sp. CAS-2024a]